MSSSLPASAAAAAPTPASTELWLCSPEDDAKPSFKLRLPHHTTHVRLALKIITTDHFGQLHETNAEFDGAPSAAWMRSEEETTDGAPAANGDLATAAFGDSSHRADPAHPQLKKQKRSHSRKRATKPPAAAPSSGSSAARQKLRVRGDPPTSASAAAAASAKSGKAAGRGKLVSILSKEDYQGAKRWRCKWEDGSESWENGKRLNRSDEPNTQRIFLNFEAKLGAEAKKAARSSNHRNDEEEKGSDESEEVPELGEDESYPERIVGDRANSAGIVEYEVEWWSPEDAKMEAPETTWEPVENLEGAPQLLQDYLREKSRKEKAQIEAGRRAAKVNSGQSDDEMSDDGLKQYEGQY